MADVASGALGKATGLAAIFGAPAPRPWLAAGIGALCAALSVLLRVAAARYIGDDEALLTVFPMVLVASLSAGAVGGWVCLVLCTVASWYLFIGEPYSFDFGPNEQGILVCTFLAGSTVIGISVMLRRSFREIAELRATEALLSRELEHRIKNTLTLVLSIARQTFRKERAMDAAFADFEGRMVAMAAAQELLSRARREPARLSEVIEHSLAPFCGIAAVDRLRIEGPDATLSDNATMALVLVLHELATNAAKYGALSAEAGEVHVAWSLPEAARRLPLTWTERGGPLVATPERRGFGSTLIDRLVTRNLRGSLRIDYPADGLTAELSLPLC